MDASKNPLGKLQQHFASLSAVHRRLVLGLAGVLVVTVVWWGRYASTPQMEAVLDQDLSLDDLVRMKAAVTERGIPCQVDGQRLLVATDRKFDALADLGYAQLLPADTHNAFDETVAKMSS